jgi:hypothetical protein
MASLVIFLPLWPWLTSFDLDAEGQVFMYQMKANMFICNMSKFLHDTTTIKFFVIFFLTTVQSSGQAGVIYVEGDWVNEQIDQGKFLGYAILKVGANAENVFRGSNG